MIKPLNFQEQLFDLLLKGGDKNISDTYQSMIQITFEHGRFRGVLAVFCMVTQDWSIDVRKFPHHGLIQVLIAAFKAEEEELFEKIFLENYQKLTEAEVELIKQKMELQEREVSKRIVDLLVKQ